MSSDSLHAGAVGDLGDIQANLLIFGWGNGTQGTRPARDDPANLLAGPEVDPRSSAPCWASVLCARRCNFKQLRIQEPPAFSAVLAPSHRWA